MTQQIQDWEEHYNLAMYFFSSIVERIVNESHLNATAGYITQLVDSGWKLNDIKNEVESFKREYPEMVRNVYTLEQIMCNKKAPNNLIEEGVFYYHNLLRETAGPARIIKDPQTGKMQRIEPTFYLEMVKSFTMENLLDYWYASSEQTSNESVIRKDKGRFDYLLGYYDIDEVLFAIDIAQEVRKKMKHKPLKNVFDLEKYMDEAKEEIKAKRSTSRMNKVDRIIKRVDEA